MKLHFYGTGASEGVPALFCECEHCRAIRKAGGRNYRLRTAVQVDEELLIDFSSDAYAQVLFRDLDLSKINHLLITHSHEDHFDPIGLLRIHPPMAFYDRERKLNIYGNQKVMDKLHKTEAQFEENKTMARYVQEYQLTSFQRFRAGDYEVTALPANHDKREECFLYLIRHGERTLLHGHDTAAFGEETWSYLKGLRLDCVVLDCTMVEETGVFEGHMGLPDDVRVRERMLDEGIVDEHTIFIATHFVHTFNPLHERITPIFAKKGFIAAYDGLEIQF